MLFSVDVKLPDTGSNTSAVAVVVPALSMTPPATNTRPSARRAAEWFCRAVAMLPAVAAKLPVAGS